MSSKGKMSVIVLVMVFMTGQLLGEINAAGKLLIPTAAGEKPYTCVILVTKAAIEIECNKNIFQPFNQFDAPKQAKIIINTAEVEEIQILNQKRKIYIVAKDSFTIRYRNVFNRISKIVGFELVISPVTVENWALIFTGDNPDDIKALGEELTTILGKRCDVRS